MKKTTYENLKKASTYSSVLAGIGTCIGAGIGVILNLNSDKVEDNAPEETKKSRFKKSKEDKK